MVKFKNINEINKYKSWDTVTAFKSKDHLVHKNGYQVAKNYHGHCLQIVAKKTKKMPLLKLLARRILGGLAVCLSLSLARKNRTVKKLIYQTKESVYFAKNVQHLPEPIKPLNVDILPKKNTTTLDLSQTVKSKDPIQENLSDQIALSPTKLEESKALEPTKVELPDEILEPSQPALPPEIENLISTIAASVKAGAAEAEVCKILKSAESEGTLKIKDQEIAKAAFKKAMMDILGSEVTYITASEAKDPPLPLDKSSNEYKNFKEMIGWKRTDGVEFDIENASKDGSVVHQFSIASQYNCAESMDDSTPSVGNAVVHSQSDPTQGPRAQRTNPIAFELVVAFLTHMGFNMMNKALPESIGKTYPTAEVPRREDGKTAILNGYLQPAGWYHNSIEQLQQESTGNLKEVTDYLESHINLFETVCYSSKPKGGGDNPVYMTLAAAPNMCALNYGPDRARFEYLTTKANFETQLKQTHELLKSHPEKDLIFHATMPGLGAFGGDSTVFANAAEDSLWKFYTQLNDNERKRVKIEFSVYVGDGQGFAYQKAKAVVDQLELKEIKAQDV